MLLHLIEITKFNPYLCQQSWLRIVAALLFKVKRNRDENRKYQFSKLLLVKIS